VAVAVAVEVGVDVAAPFWVGVGVAVGPALQLRAAVSLARATLPVVAFILTAVLVTAGAGRAAPDTPGVPSATK
jgi:hypothetical protein